MKEGVNRLQTSEIFRMLSETNGMMLISDNEKSYFAVEKAFGCSSKAEWGTYSAHFLLISLTDDFCDDMT